MSAGNGIAFYAVAALPLHLWGGAIPRGVIKVKLQDLQDRLRAHIRARIRRRELTGSDLSRQAGFQQGHLSNFLNSRRGLSLESMDRLLDTLQIEMLDLVDAGEIQRRLLPPVGGDGLENIARVSAEHAARLPRFTSEQVRGTVSFRKTYLRRLKPKDVCGRADWLRFVFWTWTNDWSS